ncbi:MAG: hypothetical protein QNL04_09570, partial [SAR324 cluster bacterium]|nr:hypothetical protein [SAR324 cluster bacterium]
MKHFFQVQKKLDSFSKKKILDQAIQELKVKPINPSNLDSAFEVVCINSTNIAEYVAPGFETLLLAKNLNIETSISPKFLGDVEKLITGGAGQVAAYILGNIQTKEIEKYFDLILDLKRDYDDFESLVLVHLSDQDMLAYLRDFLTASVPPAPENTGEEGEEGAGEAEEAGTGSTKIEVFMERAPDPWQTITKESDLQGVAQGTRRPGILDRPFFSDIKLKLKMNNAEKIQELPIGKIKTALGHFNKRLDASGMVHRSRSSLFLKWKDIEAFKIASAQ